MPAAKSAQFPTLEALNTAIVAYNLCPRLRNHSTEVARVRRRAYMEWEYWGLPVPSFDDPNAGVLALGLAPGAHGSNRTGRPFSGDGSGDFLYPVPYEAGSPGGLGAEHLRPVVHALKMGHHRLIHLFEHCAESPLSFRFFIVKTEQMDTDALRLSSVPGMST
jgi:uracil DNA glycosylase superfamily protein